MYKRGIAVACALIGALSISVNVCAAATGEGSVLDGSVSAEEENQVTKLFDWDFGTFDEIMPLGDYYALGYCGITQNGTHSVYINAFTDCYVRCDTVKATATLQKYKNGAWRYVTERSNTGYNTNTITARDTIGVLGGYTYRVVSSHSATKNGRTETDTIIGKTVYVD